MSTLNLPPLPRVVVSEVITRALSEDLARGDLTTDATVPLDVQASCVLRAREPLTLAGVGVFASVFKAVDPQLEVEIQREDGARMAAGDVGAVIRGAANPILKGERVALNLIQRMCGVATKTASFVDALPAGATTRITDTRKTTPGLRALERYAVRCGGGHNHRDDLSSAVLIKDNHVAAAGGVSNAIRRARAFAPHTSKIECEVDTFEQLDEALEAGADIVMLDNFDDDDLVRAVAVIEGRAFIEVSGGVTLARIPKIAAAGVDAISIGGLTHSARGMDLGLDWS
ncbi:MAG: carboxylating nicotinate-nucleotide diphosphorylase [Sandaracinaceae bacterium]